MVFRESFILSEREIHPDNREMYWLWKSNMKSLEKR